MSSKRPTAKQLAIPQDTCTACWQTFVSPRTRSKASAEIRWLKNVRASGFTFAERTAEQAARGALGDAAGVQSWEIAGRGSNCRWSR